MFWQYITSQNDKRTSDQANSLHYASHFFSPCWNEFHPMLVMITFFRNEGRFFFRFSPGCQNLTLNPTLCTISASIARMQLSITEHKLQQHQAHQKASAGVAFPQFQERQEKHELNTSSCSTKCFRENKSHSKRKAGFLTNTFQQIWFSLRSVALPVVTNNNRPPCMRHWVSEDWIFTVKNSYLLALSNYQFNV